MLPSKNKPDPYVSFKDDKARCIALMSRNARDVLVVLIVVLGGPTSVALIPTGVLRLLGA